MNCKFLIISILSIPLISDAQVAKRISTERIHKHLSILASDSFEGRRAGSKGEMLAADYISKQFAQLKLSHYTSEHTYFQHFEIFDGYDLSTNSFFSLNGVHLQYIKDYFPLSFSANKGSEKSEVFLSLNEPNQIWIIDAFDIVNASKSSPHADLTQDLKNLAKTAEKKGASSILFYVSDTSYTPTFFTDKFKDPINIPVFFVKKSAVLLKAKDQNDQLSIKFSLELTKKYRTSTNVIGHIDNKKPETVIIGAHYDHLGFGEDGNSMLKSPSGMIHNGADDNASGTSGLLELARQLMNREFRHYNYILIAFSGEELGLLGSKYFADSHDYANKPIKYMINMDMIGRLNDSTKSITLGGYGTSDDWSNIISSTISSSLKFKIDSSGTGPSDHTSFYRKNVPVLFYFTGIHADYHKPTDDVVNINVNGIKEILSHILSVQKASKDYKLSFKKTREQQTSTNVRFSVSLGIMPDYAYQGDGVRIDGISEGKLAAQIGLQPSDIILKLGSTTIQSVESYMKALSAYKSGDSTELTYKRGANTITVQIKFK